MANYSTAGKTPANVAATATQPGVLDHGKLSLIGLFGPDQDMRALVRVPGGRFKQVARGERVGGARVVGIDAEGVVLSANGRTRRLALPKM